jgi:hypothetical protein
VASQADAMTDVWTGRDRTALRDFEKNDMTDCSMGQSTKLATPCWRQHTSAESPPWNFGVSEGRIKWI